MVGSVSPVRGARDRYRTTDRRGVHGNGRRLASVVPFCPQFTCRPACSPGRSKSVDCHHSLTTLHRQAESLKPPRATFLDFPLGCPAGKPRNTISTARSSCRPGDRRGRSRAVELSPASVPVERGRQRDWKTCCRPVPGPIRDKRKTATNTAQNRSGLVGNEQEFQRPLRLLTAAS